MSEGPLLSALTYDLHHKTTPDVPCRTSRQVTVIAEADALKAVALVMVSAVLPSQLGELGNLSQD